MGSMDQLINIKVGTKCYFNFFRQERCDIEYHEFEGVVPRKGAVFRKYDETSLLNSECGFGTFMTCVAIWVKDKFPKVELHNVASYCILTMRCSETGAYSRLQSGAQIQCGSVTMTFRFECPRTEEQVLTNSTHIFRDIQVLESHLEHGYISKVDGIWQPNIRLELDNTGPSQFSARSDFSYEYTLPNAVRRGLYYNQPVEGLIEYTSILEQPITYMMSSAPCNRTLRYASTHNAETHEHYFVVSMLGAPKSNCSLNCYDLNYDLNVRYTFQMVNGVAFVHLTGNVSCVWGFNKQTGIPSKAIKLKQTRVQLFKEIPQDHPMLAKGETSSISQWFSDAEDTVQKGFSYSKKVVVIILVAYVLGPKYPVAALVAIGVIWSTSVVAIHPEMELTIAENVLFLGATIGVVHPGWIPFLLMLGSILLMLAKLRPDVKVTLPFAILCFFSVHDKWNFLILIASYCCRSVLVLIWSKIEDEAIPFMTKGSVAFSSIFRPVLTLKSAGRIVVKNPVMFLTRKLLQVIHLQYVQPRRCREYPALRYSVSNLKDRIFFRVEYNLIQHILKDLTKEEIEDAYHVGLTVASREPFDLSFLDFLRWRSKIKEQIISRCFDLGPTLQDVLG